MDNTQHEVEAYVDHIVFPATKEELINGLLVRNAPGRMIALVERLPLDRYQNIEELRGDLEEVAHIHTQEISGARTYQDFMAVVMRHVGDVRHTNKDEYNRVVDNIVHSAEKQGILDHNRAREMRVQLEAAFADIRGSMTDVTNDQAPIDPRRDLPRER